VLPIARRCCSSRRLGCTRSASTAVAEVAGETQSRASYGRRVEEPRNSRHLAAGSPEVAAVHEPPADTASAARPPASAPCIGLDLVDLSAEAARNPLLELPEDPMPQASSR